MKITKSDNRMIGEFKEGELIHYFTNEKEKKLGTITEIKKVNSVIEKYTIKDYKNAEEITITILENMFSTDDRFEKIELFSNLNLMNYLQSIAKSTLNKRFRNDKDTISINIGEILTISFFGYTEYNKQEKILRYGLYFLKEKIDIQLLYDIIKNNDFSHPYLVKSFHLSSFIDLLNTNEIEYNLENIIPYIY